ncbi:MAG: amidohydrolase family protein [Deltaproteobacteria bacterium]|nr:amidohydrolase family protein [Deltaproteobacteria bacterium]MBI2182411.1 amidohydrolase family protein [Deltaproteobacteria bacterium]MBI2366389.1 amidohydrolase family protein [Deltaproteobacteria bacterium]MBI2531081.1 amidohydrolase family protein [Deltaproteobacteria bacterium]MBI3066790.1 amidohydrolase family protein [Deltaproteobacteria bacterium]
MKTLIQGGFVVGFNGTEHEIFKDGVVVFEGNRIEFVGKDYSQPVDNKLDARDCLVSPGFIDTHFHSGINASDYILNDSTKTDFFASNYLAHGGPTREGAHAAHLKDIDVGQRFSLIHVLKSGVTTTFEIGGPGAEAQRYVDMVDQVGIRCATGPSYKNVSFFHDRQGRLEYDWDDERGSQGLKAAVDFAKKYNGGCNGRMTTMLFPGHVDSCTPALLKDTKRAAQEIGVGIQIHATINLFEFHTVMQRERCTPIELLHKLGFLGPDVSLSHCIFISGHSWLAYPYGDDLKIIADSGASVAYSPLKYLKLGIVMESFDKYRQAGINMGIGTDTFPKDIISDMRYAALASRLADKSFLAGHPRDVFNAVTLGGAKMLGRDDLGRLQKGAKADITIVNLRDIAFGAVRDPIRSLMETAVSRDVRTVIVDGETLVDNGKYLRLNEDELLEKVQAKGEQIWDSVPKWHWTGKSVDEVVPPSFKMR